MSVWIIYVWIAKYRLDNTKHEWLLKLIKFRSMVIYETKTLTMKYLIFTTADY